MPLYKKELLKPGIYHTAAGRVEFSARDINDIYRYSTEMLKAGRFTPVPLEHQNSALPVNNEERLANRVLHNTGWVKNYELQDGTLWAYLDIEHPDVAKNMRNIKFVSPEIRCNFNADGKIWPKLITHVALTTYPVWRDQKPMSDPEPLSQRLSHGTLRLSLATHVPIRRGILNKTFHHPQTVRMGIGDINYLPVPHGMWFRGKFYNSVIPGEVLQEATRTEEGRRDLQELERKWRIQHNHPKANTEQEPIPHSVPPASHVRILAKHLKSAADSHAIPPHNVYKPIEKQVLVWEDPRDGRTHVLSGHDYVNSLSSGQAQIHAIRINAKNQEDAHHVAFLMKVARGEVDPVEATHFFRNSKSITPKDVVDYMARHGVELKKENRDHLYEAHKYTQHLLDDQLDSLEGREIDVADARKIVSEKTGDDSYGEPTQEATLTKPAAPPPEQTVDAKSQWQKIQEILARKRKQKPPDVKKPDEPKTTEPEYVEPGEPEPVEGEGKEPEEYASTGGDAAGEGDIYRNMPPMLHLMSKLIISGHADRAKKIASYIAMVGDDKRPRDRVTPTLKHRNDILSWAREHIPYSTLANANVPTVIGSDEINPVTNSKTKAANDIHNNFIRDAGKLGNEIYNAALKLSKDGEFKKFSIVDNEDYKHAAARFSEYSDDEERMAEEREGDETFNPKEHHALNLNDYSSYLQSFNHVDHANSPDYHGLILAMAQEHDPKKFSQIYVTGKDEKGAQKGPHYSARDNAMIDLAWNHYADNSRWPSHEDISRVAEDAGLTEVPDQDIVSSMREKARVMDVAERGDEEGDSGLPEGLSIVRGRSINKKGKRVDDTGETATGGPPPITWDTDEDYAGDSIDVPDDYDESDRMSLNVRRPITILGRTVRRFSLFG